MLKTNTTLLYLNISHGSVNDTIAKGIATGLTNNSSLEILDVSHSTPLSDSVVAEILSANPGSQNLLSHLHITLSGGQCSHISNTWNRQVVDKSDLVFFCALNQNSMKIQLKETNLKFDLAEACVTCSKLNAISLFQYLECNTSVEVLDLSENMRLAESESDAIAIGHAIERMLKANTALRELNLSHGSVNNFIAKGVAAGFSKSSVVRLNMSCNTTFSDSTIVANILSAANSNRTCLKVELPFGIKLSRTRSSPQNVWKIQVVDNNADLVTVNMSDSWISALNQSTLQVTCLDLRQANVTTSSVIGLFQYVMHNTSVEVLHLEENPQLTEGNSQSVAYAIERMLETNTTLRTLILSHGSVNDTIAKGIAAGLTKNSSLEKLDISHNTTLSDSVMADILSSANVNRSLCHLTVCGVELSRAQSEDTWKMRVVNKMELPLFFCPLNQSTLKIPQVASLDLRYTKITSGSAIGLFQYLEHNTSVEVLDLKRNPQLTEGDSQAVGQAIERMLETNTTLKTLILSHGSVNDTIAKGIAAGLTKNSSLEKLDISHNTTLSNSDSETVGQAIEKILETNSSLKTLILSHGSVNDTIAKGIVAGLTMNSESSLVRLDVSHNTSLSVSRMADILSSANSNRSLCRLVICGVELSRAQSEDTWKMRVVNKMELPLFFCPLNQSTLKIPQVASLDLRYTKITSSSAIGLFQYLEHNTSVEVLDLKRNPQLTEGDSEAVGQTSERMLETNTTLKDLNLSHGSVNDTIAKGIAAGLTKNSSLERLDVSHNTALSDSVMADILSSANVNRSLCHLTVCGVELSRAQSENTWNMQVIDKVELPLLFCPLNQSTMKDKLFLQRPVLKLNRTNMTSSSAIGLFQYLEYNTSVEVLYIEENPQLTDGDSEAVGHAIERMLKTNKTLNLSHGSINDTIATKGIAAGLTKNSFLERLNVSRNTTLNDSTIASNVIMSSANSSNTCGICLSRAKPSSQKWNLEFVDKNGCTVSTSDSMIESLIFAPNQNILQVAYLNLRQIRITSSYAVNLFQYLEYNTSVEILVMGSVQLMTEGDSLAVSYEIERMLETNTTLKVLNLSHGSVSDTIAKGIAAGLTKNSSLERLDVSCYTTLSVSVMADILSSANLNRTLRHLHLDACGVELSRAQSEDTWNMQVIDKIELPLLFCPLNQSTMKIPEMPSLDLSHTNITSSSAISLFQYLEHSASVEVLDLRGNPQLEEGDSEAFGCAIERMLEASTTLKALNLSHCSVDDTIAKGIAAGLSKNSSLERLDVSHNTAWSKSVMADILSSANLNRSLCYLAIYGVELYCDQSEDTWNLEFEEDTDFLLHVFCALNHSEIKTRMNSTYLNLAYSEFTSSNAVALFQYLEHDTSLEELILSGNTRLAAGDSEAVANALENLLLRNSALSKLYIANCSLPSTVIFHLFKGLCHNTFLKELDISENTLNKSNTIAMAEMLLHNKTLTRLIVGWCWIVESGPRVPVARDNIKLIAGALLRNTTLETLSIGWAPEKKVLCEEIERAKREEIIDTSNWKLQIL